MGDIPETRQQDDDSDSSPSLDDRLRDADQKALAQLARTRGQPSSTASARSAQRGGPARSGVSLGRNGHIPVVTVPPKAPKPSSRIPHPVDHQFWANIDSILSAIRS